VFYPFARHGRNPDVQWHDERHATVFYNGRVWQVQEDEAHDWLIFVREGTKPVHRITSGGCSEAFRWIAGRPPSWTAAKKGGDQ
jgi:hypothetical protein